MMKINIQDVKWDNEFYPRVEPDQHQVGAYRQALENLPPIDVNKNMMLIDGYHRLLAHRQEGKTEIEANILDIPDNEVLIESVRRNSTHGLQLNMEDKKRMAVKLYQENGRRSLSTTELAELLSVHQNSILNWTKSLRDAEMEEENRIIWNMWLRCATQEEIAEQTKIPQRTISERLSKIHKNVEIANPDPLNIFNIWHFNHCDPQFGIEYPGRIPGQIVQHVLYYYTEPFDTVVDLFGGGGVTVDVCKAMARRYRVYDIQPVRDDMKQHDATTGFPQEARGCDLVFLDPPYWKQKQGDYTDHATNLSNFEYKEFTEELVGIIHQSLDNCNGHVAVIIGASQDGGKYYDHSADLMRMVNADIVQRVIVPYSTQRHGGAYVNMAKENKRMLYLYRDLIIWRK